jgi:hypothetical protein
MGSGAVRVPRTFGDLGGTATIGQGGTGAADAPTAKANLGLGNVNNTADADKPVSTATANALAAKAALAANAFTGTQTVNLAGHATSKGVVVTPDASQTANLIDCGSFFVRPDGGHVVRKDWDQLASDPHISLASKTHPNRMFYGGYVDTSNYAVLASIDLDAGVNTPVYVYCSYLSVSSQIQAQDSLYVATQASSTQSCLQVLHHAQQGTGNDVNLIAFPIHNYTDGAAIVADNVGSGPAMRLRNAHNSTARPDKASGYVGTGPFLVCSVIDSSTFSVWSDLFTIDVNGCAIWKRDWNDSLSTDAPIQVRSLTHPNRCLYMGVSESSDSATIGMIDLDTFAFKNLTFRAASTLFSDGPLTLPAYTVATLPTPPGPYATAFVSDATAPTWNGTLTGGGTTKCRVWYDGSVWRAG